MYVIVSIVIYRYAGTDVASPALGSTSPLLEKIAYGIAIPTIVIAGMYISQPVPPIPNVFYELHNVFHDRKALRTPPKPLFAPAWALKGQR